MVKKAITFLLISILFVNCKKDKPIVLSSSNYGDIINQEFTGDLAFKTTSFVEQYWRVVGNTGFNKSIYRIAEELEKVIAAEYPQYLKNEDLVIKISGCMNACGQHNMANIGFQGMTVRTPEKLVAPALQVLLGGGNFGNGNGAFADKVVKVPSKRGPEALRRILNDFEANANGKEFAIYYKEKGEKYFYDFLNDLQDVSNLTQEDFIDWGEEVKYVKEIGIGECAGVVIDLIATLFLESDEKIENANEAFENGVYSGAIYYAYQSIVNSAKASLLAENKKTNTHSSIISQFDEVFILGGKIDLGTSFSDLIYQINKFAPTKEFAEKYIKDAGRMLQKVRAFRTLEIS
jgi:sulfite reductase (ferredoxin)